MSTQWNHYCLKRRPVRILLEQTSFQPGYVVWSFRVFGNIFTRINHNHSNDKVNLTGVSFSLQSMNMSPWLRFWGNTVRQAHPQMLRPQCLFRNRFVREKYLQPGNKEKNCANDAMNAFNSPKPWSTTRMTPNMGMTCVQELWEHHWLLHRRNPPRKASWCSWTCIHTYLIQIWKYRYSDII